jgi:hypothetical protein
MHGDLLMAMDSGDSSRRQRQAGLARGRQIRDRSLPRASADQTIDSIATIAEGEAGTATRRKLGCRSCASRFRLMSSL